MLLCLAAWIVATATARAGEFLEVRDDLPLSKLLLIPKPAENSPANHGVHLDQPIAIEIKGPLPRPAKRAGEELVYFRKGEATSEAPGWTAYCELARRDDSPPTPPGGAALPLMIHDTCWAPPPGPSKEFESPLKGRGQGAPADDEHDVTASSLVDLRMGSQGSWAIQCHNLPMGITVGGLRDIFGRDRISIGTRAKDVAGETEAPAPPPRRAAATSRDGRARDHEEPVPTKAQEPGKAPEPEAVPTARPLQFPAPAPVTNVQFN